MRIAKQCRTLVECVRCALYGVMVSTMVGVTTHCDTIHCSNINAIIHGVEVVQVIVLLCKEYSKEGYTYIGRTCEVWII